MNPTDQWSGAFGTEYTRRNRVDWRKRIPFWREIIDGTGARSVLEIGCNAGWNLSAIRQVDHLIKTIGIEINTMARDQARAAGLTVWEHETFAGQPLIGPESFELVFTAGVLIHIPPDELDSMLRRIVNLSCDWVLAIEYEAERETEIEYRGQKGMLWKRPYGMLYRGLGLEPVLTRKVGKDEGFDDCTAWMMRKR